MRSPAWLVSLDAGPTVGWAGVLGDNFWRNLGGRSFEWGGDGGLRAGRWFGRFAVWSEARVTVWANGQQARLGGADGNGPTADLPLADVALRLGLSVRAF